LGRGKHDCGLKISRLQMVGSGAGIRHTLHGEFLYWRGDNYSSRAWQSVTGLFEPHGGANDSKAGEDEQVEISQDSIPAMAEDKVEDRKH
jgi:hypothetical protein